MTYSVFGGTLNLTQPTSMVGLCPEASSMHIICFDTNVTDKQREIPQHIHCGLQKMQISNFTATQGNLNQFLKIIFVSF